VPAPCNPWGGDVGDDLSLVIPKKLSSAQKATTHLAQVGVMDIGLKKQQCGHADAGRNL
jgi:hypothetical protein